MESTRINKSFWNGKKVFLTGIKGFIGGNLAKELLNAGAEVFGLVRDQKPSSFLNHEGIDKKVTLIQGDLIDYALIRRVLNEEQIDVIFHLAAQVEVVVARENPFATWETNVRGTYTLMEAARECGHPLQAIVVASTDKAYGDYPREKMPYREDYPLIPRYPYDVSKACSDMIAQSYASELYSMPVVVTRFCNIYGPGQLNFSAVIPDSIRSALGYSKFIPRGNGLQIRDFLYVRDVADLYMILAQELVKDPKKLRGQVFNAGTGEAYQIKDVVKKIFEILNNQAAHAEIETLFGKHKMVGEIACQYMDYKKPYEYFGWKPKWSFEEGMKETIDWFKKFLQDKK